MKPSNAKDQHFTIQGHSPEQMEASSNKHLTTEWKVELVNEDDLHVGQRVKAHYPDEDEPTMATVVSKSGRIAHIKEDE